ncbi:phosphatase PAP2 family protein [Curtobacterium luteum]|uniref:phosphatase PAP2 family protein n=1 Tax=Curtobacterium luteum TaxID=33881 RepID=UPI0037F77EBC
MTLFSEPRVLPMFTPPARRRVVIERAAVMVVFLAVVGFVVRAFPADAALSAGLNAFHVSVLGALCSAMYGVFEPVPAILLTIVITGIVWVRTRQPQVAAAFAGVVALTWIPSAALKLVVERPRPHGLTHPFVPAQPDASFPSGHVVFVTALLLAALMLIADRSRRRVAAGVGVVGVLAVATALCIDGVHWPADVIASVLWAVGVAPAARLLWVDVVLRRAAARLEQTGRHRSDDSRR